MSESTMDRVKQQFTKPLISAGVSGFALNTLFPGSSFEIGDRTVPVAIVGAGIGAASSFASELVAQWIVPQISSDQRLQNLESMIVTVGSSAGAFVLIPRLLNQNLNMGEANRLAMVGAASEVLSSYLYNNFIADVQ
jgi:hypothetical protein